MASPSPPEHPKNKTNNHEEKDSFYQEKWHKKSRSSKHNAKHNWFEN